MNYLIVGGSSGIGLALVQLLVKDNHQVYVASRSKRNLPESVHFIELDVLNNVSHLNDFLPQQLDGLAYCPGTINLKPFSRLSEQDFSHDFAVNVLGAVKVIQTVLPKLKASKTSSIVLFSSVAVKTGMGFHASVSASKGAVEGLALSLASEFAPYKIRVNVIAPSLTDTPLAANLLSSPERREASDKRHPLGRIGKADEIAEMAKFLLSEKSTWITGQTIGIDGGMGNLK